MSRNTFAQLGGISIYSMKGWNSIKQSAPSTVQSVNPSNLILKGDANNSWAGTSASLKCIFQLKAPVKLWSPQTNAPANQQGGILSLGLSDTPKATFTYSISTLLSGQYTLWMNMRPIYDQTLDYTKVTWNIYNAMDSELDAVCPMFPVSALLAPGGYSSTSLQIGDGMGAEVNDRRLSSVVLVRDALQQKTCYGFCLEIMPKTTLTTNLSAVSGTMNFFIDLPGQSIVFLRTAPYLILGNDAVKMSESKSVK